MVLTDRQQHRQLYKRIPTFTCKTGCTACCGPVPVSDYEARRLGIAGQTVTATQPDSLACQFLTDQGCSVYDRRPYMCRLFGTVDTPLLTCPHGCGPRTPLSEQQGRQLTDHYIRLKEL